MTEIETMSLEDIKKYAKTKCIESVISEINSAFEEGRVTDVIYRDVTFGKYRMYSVMTENKPKGE